MKKNLLLSAITILLFGFSSCSDNRNVTDEDVVINGVRWATRNVDRPGRFAPTPESFGMFYQWNRERGWSVQGREVAGWDNSIPEGTKWYAQNDPCPNGWRVPTREEIQSLYDAGFSEWTWSNGVNGRFFGTYPNQIFLPVSGWRFGEGGALFDVYAHSSYWGSTQDSNESAVALWFSHSSVYVINDWRQNGLFVRCVKK